MPEKQLQPATKAGKEAVMKVGGQAFINWMFGLMASVILIPVAIIALDFYWFLTLFNNKLAKIGIIRGTFLAGLNILLIFIIIISSMTMYCLTNPIECGWETAKSAVTGGTETTAK